MAHILIVEDEAMMQTLIRTMLESAGHSVDEAWDGGDALDILYTDPNPFDMIVLDVRMPKMDGFELLSKLQNHPFRPPVIILSAALDKIPQALESMVSGRLIKPFRRQQLNDTVNRLLGEPAPTPRYTPTYAEQGTEYSLHTSPPAAILSAAMKGTTSHD